MDSELELRVHEPGGRGPILPGRIELQNLNTGSTSLSHEAANFKLNFKLNLKNSSCLGRPGDTQAAAVSESAGISHALTRRWRFKVNFYRCFNNDEHSMVDISWAAMLHDPRRYSVSTA